MSRPMIEKWDANLTTGIFQKIKKTPHGTLRASAFCLEEYSLKNNELVEDSHPNNMCIMPQEKEGTIKLMGT